MLVPAGTTWLVKSVALGVTPAASTGLAAFEVPTRQLATPHQAPGGQMLALDVNVTTGVAMLGPVASTPQPPPPPPPPVSTMASSIADGAVLKGSVVWIVTPSKPTQRVEFAVNNVPSPGVEFVPPYQFNGDPSGVLNTTAYPNGLITLKATAFYNDGTSESRIINVTVAN